MGRYSKPRIFRGNKRKTVLCLDDILDRVNKTDNCWLWTGATNDKGYGQVQYEGKRKYVHRLVYAFTYGEPTQNVCHTCDNPLCCNPEHLFDASQSDNMRDAANKGRIKNQWSEL